MALIIADAREDKGATPHLAAIAKDITVMRAQIYTGDYLILINGVLKLVIERKTWKDLAASIKDGRMRTQEPKMQEMRKLCRVIYIIEGNLSYADDRIVCGVPFGNLHAKMRHNILRGLPSIQSKDEAHTAQIIVKLARDLLLNEEKLKTDYMTELMELQARYRGCDTGNAAEIFNLIEDMIPKTAGVEPYQLPDQIAKRQEPDDFDIVVRMWKSLQGIGENTAAKITTVASIADVFNNHLALVEVPFGRSKFGAEKSISIHTRLRSREVQARILAEIPRITLDTAELILDHFEFKDIIAGDVNPDAIRNLRGRNGRRVGPAADKIFPLLHLKG